MTVPKDSMPPSPAGMAGPSKIPPHISAVIIPCLSEPSAQKLFFRDDYPVVNKNRDRCQCPDRRAHGIKTRGH